MHKLLIQHGSSRSAVSHRLLSDLTVLSLITHFSVHYALTFFTSLHNLGYWAYPFLYDVYLGRIISAEYNISVYKYGSKPRLN